MRTVLTERVELIRSPRPRSQRRLYSRKWYLSPVIVNAGSARLKSTHAKYLFPILFPFLSSFSHPSYPSDTCFHPNFIVVNPEFIMDSMYDRDMRDQWENSLLGVRFWEDATKHVEQLTAGERKGMFLHVLTCAASS